MTLTLDHLATHDHPDPGGLDLAVRPAVPRVAARPGALAAPPAPRTVAPVDPLVTMPLDADLDAELLALIHSEADPELEPVAPPTTTLTAAATAALPEQRCAITDFHWSHAWERPDFRTVPYRIVTFFCPGQDHPAAHHPAIVDTFDGDFDFYTGCPEPGWLWRYPGPWCVSHNRLSRRKRFKPVLRGQRWMLDSGGFTVLRREGRWTSSPDEYAAAVRRYHDEIGGLDHAAIQDWMCEPYVIHGGTHNGMAFAGTGLSVREHQHLTVGNYIDLVDADPDLPWMPVLQGQSIADYERCVELYERAGVDLRRVPRVGIGSLCRRQVTREIRDLITRLADYGLALHGFGVKTLGLDVYGRVLASADSMSWGMEARKQKLRMSGCTHKVCNYCPRWALTWLNRLLARLGLV